MLQAKSKSKDQEMVPLLSNANKVFSEQAYTLPSSPINGFESLKALFLTTPLSGKDKRQQLFLEIIFLMSFLP